MLRFRLTQLLQAKAEQENRVIHWREVSEATGVSVSVLSTLASPRVGATTNTRYLEALLRYFRCAPNELIEFVPPLGEEPGPHVTQLYPRAASPNLDSAS